MSNDDVLTSTRNVVATVKSAVNATPIAILVDAYRLEKNRKDDPAKILTEFAEAVGRIDRCAMFAMSTSNVEDTWLNRGFHVVRQERQNTKVSIPLITNAVEIALLKPYIKTVVVAATDCDNYIPLFEELQRMGVLVIAVSLSGGWKGVTTDYGRIVYTRLKELASVEKEPQQVTPQNLSSYDFTQFIQLMDASEAKMPFVGVRFFINKVMWRLGNTDPQVCQDIFHQAEEIGIIELYKSANINEGAPDVSACRLTRDNSTVLSVLDLPLPGSAEEAGIIDVSTEEHSVAVFVGTKPTESVDSDIPTTPSDDRPTA